MITWAWHRSLTEQDAAEVADLLAEAVPYDEEAGFSTARPDAEPVGELHHLLVSMPPVGSRESPDLDALPDVRVVAYLRLDLVDGVGRVQFVVRPPFRSRGVGTLLVEQLEAEAEGWRAIAGLRALEVWAHGSHPAADRMRMRFGGETTEAVFRTLRMLGGSRPLVGNVNDVRRTPADADSWDLVPGHRDAMSPSDLTVLSRTAEELTLDGGSARAMIGASTDSPGAELATLTLLRGGDEERTELATLIRQALLILQGAGVRMVQSHVPALDDLAVSVARELDLVHDQTDVRYELDLSH